MFWISEKLQNVLSFIQGISQKYKMCLHYSMTFCGKYCKTCDSNQQECTKYKYSTYLLQLEIK